jgi:hypothetical protein
MDTTGTIDPTEVIDAAGELDAAPTLGLFSYPALGMAFVTSAYDLAKRLVAWEVTSTYHIAEKVIKYQRSSLKKVTTAAGR